MTLHLPSSGGKMLFHGETEITVVNTLVETDMFSVTITPSMVKAGDVLRVRAALDMLNNSGAGVTVVYSLYLGATQVAAVSTASATTSASRRSVKLASVISFRTLAVQTVMNEFVLGAAVGANMGTVAVSVQGYDTGAEDLASSKTLRMTAQFSVAASTIDTRLQSYSIEKLSA